MSKIVCFGEIMLRLSTPDRLKFVQANNFEVTFGGAEANVSVSLANYGEEAVFVSKVPDNDIGQSAINSLRQFGVDTSKVLRGGERLGIYYLESGASQRPSKVIYDRKYSSISGVKPGEIDWETVLSGASWFHFTGITPALSDSCAEVTLEALKLCKEKGITTSCDLNFRKKLWSTEKAGRVMGELMKYVDLCIANEEDAEKVFNIKAHDTDVSSGILSHTGYIDVAKQLTERFGFKYVAITLRESLSADDNNWSAMLYDGSESYFSKKYKVHIVDRVGGGDSFGGGLIYSLVNGYSAQEAIEFATAASCLKHSIYGDYNHITVDDVKTLLAGDGSGRVVR